MTPRAVPLALLCAWAGCAAAQPAARPGARGPAEVAYARALSEGFATGRAVACQSVTEEVVRRLAHAAADLAVRNRQTDDHARVVQNFNGGLDGGTRLVAGPSDADCPAYKREVQAIGAAYGLTIR